MIWNSDLPPVAIGGDTLHNMVLASTSSRGSAPALVDGQSGSLLTYSDLDAQIRRVAGALVSRGMTGGTATLCLPNLPVTVSLALGSLAAGMTVSMANPAYGEGELERHVASVRSTILFVLPNSADMARAVSLRAGSPEVVVVGGLDSGGTTLDEFLSGHGTARLPVVDEDFTALVFPSSGTTNLPKGVRLSHRNLVTVMRQQAACLRVTQHDATLAVTPIFHIMGFQAMVVGTLLEGGKVVLMPRFDPQLLIDLIDRYRITVLVGAPPMMPALLADRAEGRLETLDLIGSGGSALPRPIEETLRSRFSRATVGQGWGLTEMTGAVCIPRRGWRSPVGSVGKLIPNTKLRVVDRTSGKDLGPNEQGELWVTGPQVMQGYVGEPEATAEMVGPDGWLRTGDLGMVDSKGAIYISGRLKELIKVSGFQVAPAELEGLLLSHQSVRDVAVVGRPDRLRGESPVAYVVRSGDVTADELKVWIAERVTSYKRVREVKFVDAIPKSPAGKILRRLLV